MQILSLNSYDFNLDLGAERQSCNLYTGASRSLFGEILSVNAVECCEIVDVRQETGGLDNAVEGYAALCQNVLKVLHDLLSLLLDGSSLDLAGSRSIGI